MISYDEAMTWDMNNYLWIDGINADLGYPASVELPGGDIFTVFYAINRGESKSCIRWTRWRIEG